jgi:hypothetical protein
MSAKERVKIKLEHLAAWYLHRVSGGVNLAVGATHGKANEKKASRRDA